MVRLAVITPVAIFLWAAILTLLERKFPYLPGYRVFRPGFWTDLFWYALVQSYLLALVIAFIIRSVDGISGLSELRLVRDWPIWLQVVFFLVAHDLWQYWFHRFQHRSFLLWRTHEAAHAPLHVDWLAGSQSHASEILIAQTIEFAPIFLLGASPEVPLIKGLIDAIWGMYNHSNIDIKTGRLLFVLNGPELHRWHHDLETPRGGVNLSTKLSIWDWIWGTAYYPKHRKAGLYGLGNGNEFPYESYFKQFTYMFRPKRGESAKSSLEGEALEGAGLD
ncbi:MAG TPA: sterol desaturase family protein [Bacteroidota bacterium]|nr:sterol desaturase family protein [Bacteroidota bacterium]